MNDFFNLKNFSNKFIEVQNLVDNYKKVSCYNLGVAERVLISSGFKNKVLYVASDYVSAKQIFEIFFQILGDKVALLPAGSDIIVYKHAANKNDNITRLITLHKLINSSVNVVVTSADALFSYCPNPSDLANSIVNIECNKQYDINILIKKLLKIGYSQQTLVAAEGQISRRGDILDVFALGAENPFRIEFFDNNVEKIYSFSATTQKRIVDFNNISIIPCSNLLFDDSIINNLVKYLYFQANNSNPEFKTIIDNILNKFESKDFDFSLDYCFPIVENYLSSIFDYFSDNDIVIIDECKMVFDAIENNFKDLSLRKKQMIESKMSFGTNGFVAKDFIFHSIKNFKNLAFLKITNHNMFFETQFQFEFKTAPVMRFYHNYNELSKSINVWNDNKFTIFICAGNDENAKKLLNILENKGIYFKIQGKNNFDNKINSILPIEFSTGFILRDENLVLLGTYDVLPRKNKQANHLKNRNSLFSVPKVGDYVVHEIHGIGICEGITKLKGNFGVKDFVVVKYRGDDRLYVPIDQMDLLDKFNGVQTPKQLSKIGGVEFANVKAKVRNSIHELAINLLALYAERQSKSGFCFPQDDYLQLEFENAFPFTETEDQLISIAEIKKDMQSNKVMDRLLCGDVGFGKTEVAFRAAFKAVLASKQVAFLAPTTILSEQHMQTALRRFKNFGVRLAVINRFKSVSQQKEILKQLNNGEIDIIFGTHRLLSKDVHFKDLGLIILDEEQKFGVLDKEKLKLLKSNVDVLTLSATPIPRTLYMSLSGIRDISVISTPPVDRIPVCTYVAENLSSTIKDAIDKELLRGGQVFYVYNRVESIYNEAEKVKRLCPNANVIVAHGQMSSNELEHAVLEFSSGRADVLICTTIIENGIDISNANTLIVQNADLFGLASLYQIRGRVGRGNRIAYAYFLYQNNKILTEEACKRLEAISEFTEFGSGFNIAMRDLELRGSGSVIGAEQHGHLQKVGYELYCKLLSEEIAKIKKQEVEQNKEIVIKIDLDAFIPESYIPDDELRLTAYKNISLINNYDDKIKIECQLFEAFGKLPIETKNILEIALIKSMAKKLDICEVWCTLNEIKFVLCRHDKNLGISENLANSIYKYRNFVRLDMSNNPAIVLTVNNLNSQERLNMTKDFLLCALSSKN